MKINLFVARHGHSPFLGSDDFNRPLSELGAHQASADGQFIARNLVPGTVNLVASAAQRTTETANTIQQSLPQANVRFDAALYAASVGDWCQVISDHPAMNLILVGHNPTVSQLHQYLTQTPSPGFAPATVGHLTLELASDGLKLPAQSEQIFCPKS